MSPCLLFVFFMPFMFFMVQSFSYLRVLFVVFFLIFLIPLKRTGVTPVLLFIILFFSVYFVANFLLALRGKISFYSASNFFFNQSFCFARSPGFLIGINRCSLSITIKPVLRKIDRSPARISN